MRTVRRFLSNQRAATAIEYAFIAGLISVAIVLGATTMGTSFSSKFNAVASNLS